jgi:hypothetical protein
MKSLLFAILLLSASLLHASDGAISVGPAVVMLKGDYGQSATQQITVSNGTSHKLDFEMTAMDLLIREGGRVLVPAGEIAGSIAATAVFSERQVHVAPGESKSVDVTLTVPVGAEHRAVVVLFRGTNAIASGQVGVLASIGTLMTFELSNRVSFETAKPVITPQTNAENVRVTQSCSNTGTEPVMIRGVAAMLNAKGVLVGRLDLEPRRLLPRERADVGGEYASEFAPGQYKLLLTMTANDQTLTSTTDVVVQ